MNHLEDQQWQVGEEGQTTAGLDEPSPRQLPPGLRVTVNLSPRATAALHQIVDLTGDSKTEAINKALQAYALIQSAQENEGGAWLQQSSSSKPVQIRFY